MDSRLYTLASDNRVDGNVRRYCTGRSVTERYKHAVAAWRTKAGELARSHRRPVNLHLSYRLNCPPRRRAALLWRRPSAQARSVYLSSIDAGATLQRSEIRDVGGGAAGVDSMAQPFCFDFGGDATPVRASAAGIFYPARSGKVGADRRVR